MLTKRRCGTNYKAQPMCSNMFNHILLMCPSLVVQLFLQKYWFAVLALSARVPGAVAVMKRLHRKTLEIPSASSRTLISKQRCTARERTCSLWLYLGKDSPRLSDTVVQLHGWLLGGFWSLTGHREEHQAGAAELEKQRQDLGKGGCLAYKQMLVLRKWSCLERHREKMEIS